jgi:hypothetical protein
MKTIRTILISILLIIALQCAVSAQTVTIKASTAEYFLEADDERYLLRDAVIELENDKVDLKKQVTNLGAINMTYMVEAVKSADEFNLVIDELNTCYGDQDEAIVVIEKLEKQNKFLKTLLKIGAGAIVVLAIL